jgi:hypothetical protein
MNDLAQFQPAFNGVNTLLAVSTNIETEQITNGNLKLKGNSSFQNIFEQGQKVISEYHQHDQLNARALYAIAILFHS